MSPFSDVGPADPAALATAEGVEPKSPWAAFDLTPMEKTGLARLAQWLGKSAGDPAGGPAGRPIGPALIDGLIGQVDKAIADWLNAIIKAPAFKSLERIWRSLDFLVSRVDFRENVRIEILNVSQKDLLEDFLDSPEIGKSGLYRLAYVAEYGQFGGQPIGAVVCDYEIENSPEDYRLLAFAAEVGAAVHAPFLFSVGPKFFGARRFADLDQIRDLTEVFRQKPHARWRALRESENSRYLALAWPSFLLRRPYDPESTFSLNFEEKTEVESDYLWGSAAFALALAMADSFAKYRWCVNVVGESGGGLIEGLCAAQVPALGRGGLKPSLRFLASESRESALAEEGIITLMALKEPGSAVFLSANSALRARRFTTSEGGAQASLSHRLSTQLPYMMIVNRLAHYLKVLQREGIGSWKGAAALEVELNKWLNRFVTDMDNPEPLARGRHPLRRARATVQEEEGRPGWHRVNLTVRPHFKRLGANFDLNLTGRLEKLDWGG
ncbi:MAG: type VI secretion system contractile sheath large subunit [Deltaproteobacteria bacterium]|jgi:type VI secretion system protein ImpC|nr:type VI secretion system contractile sheath large subunit [Deltaproteobacteria bacterium]